MIKNVFESELSGEEGFEIANLLYTGQLNK